MKFLAVVISLLILAACGGGSAPPVATINATVPSPTRNAARVAGGSGIAIHVYQALHGQAPSNAMLTSYVGQIGTGNGYAWADSMPATFSSMTDSVFSTLVLNNLSVTATSLPAYDVLHDALMWYFQAAGVARRGMVIIQLSEILSSLEGDTIFGAAALAFNNQTAANFAYSTNPANTVPATILTPTASAGTPQSVVVGALATLDGTASSADIRKTLTFAWTLTSRPVGSLAGLSSLTAARPTFTPDVAGSYVVTLIVSDGTVASNAAHVNITAAANVAPVGNAGIAQSVFVGTSVTLDASASSDANGDHLNYAWTLTAKPLGSTATLVSPASDRPTLTPDLPGGYVASLVVSDGKLSSTPVTVSISAISIYVPPVTGVCCRVCTTGKPCGDSCIARSYTCRAGSGCAC